MRNICQCDVCGLYAEMLTNCRVPVSWEKIDGLDFCKDCKVEYKKRYRKMWQEFVKSKLGNKEKSLIKHKEKKQ